MKEKTGLITTGVSCVFLAVLIFMVCCVDVESIGPEGTSIGLSHLNRFVFELTGVNMLWYNITDWLGIAAILTAFIFAVTGFVQMIKRRSLFKVDRELLALGGLYLVVIGVYILFEKVIVNYRPVIMPGCTQPEASFPSSHTMLVCVIMGSAAMLIGKYIRCGAPGRALQVICYVMIGITVLGRLLSGVHWFTDIMGGILISIALLSIYKEVIGCIRRRAAYDQKTSEEENKQEDQV